MRYINPYNQEIRVNKYDTWDYPICVNTFACINDRKHLPIKLSNYNYDFSNLRPFRFDSSDSNFEWTVNTTDFATKAGSVYGAYTFKYTTPQGGTTGWYVTKPTTPAVTEATNLTEYGITAGPYPYIGLTLRVMYHNPYSGNDAVYFNIYDFNSTTPLVSKKIALATGLMSARTPDYVDGEGYINLYVNKPCTWMYDEDGNLILNMIPEDFAPCEIDEYQYDIILNCKAPSPSTELLVDRRITLVERAPLIICGSDFELW